MRGLPEQQAPCHLTYPGADAAALKREPPWTQDPASCWALCGGHVAEWQSPVTSVVGTGSFNVLQRNPRRSDALLIPGRRGLESVPSLPSDMSAYKTTVEP